MHGAIDLVDVGVRSLARVVVGSDGSRRPRTEKSPIWHYETAVGVELTERGHVLERFRGWRDNLRLITGCRLRPIRNPPKCSPGGSEKGPLLPRPTRRSAQGS